MSHVISPDESNYSVLREGKVADFPGFANLTALRETCSQELCQKVNRDVVSTSALLSLVSRKRLN